MKDDPRQEPTEEGGGPQSVPGGVGRARILILDDEEDIRAMIAEILEARGHQVRTRATVASGIDLLREESFDLLITDLYLEDAAGWEAAEAAKKAGENIAVLIITGGSTRAEAAGGRPGLADRILHKPFRLSEIAEAVDEILKGKRAEPA